MSYDDGKTWLKQLNGLEKVVDLVRSGRVLDIDTGGDAESGYTQMIVDNAVGEKEWFDNFVAGFARFEWADEADDVREATYRLLQKLYELRAMGAGKEPPIHGADALD